MRSTAVVALSVGLLIACCVLTSAEVVVSVTGRAEARSASPQAVDEAKASAMQQAVASALRQFAQNRIDPRTWASERSPIEWFLRVRGRDYVLGYGLTTAPAREGSLVRVRVNVRLRDDAFRKALLAELARPTTLIVTVVPAGGATDAQAHGLDTAVTEALTEAGGTVVAQEWLDEVRWHKQAEALLHADPVAACAIGLGFLADLSVKVTLNVRPSQDNAGIISALASADLQAVRLRDGQIAFAHHFDPQKGFGLDLAQASGKAVDQLSPAIVGYVSREVGKYRVDATREIRITSAKPLPAERWEALAAALRECKSVRETTRDTSDGTAGLACKVEGGALLVAAVADNTPGLKAVSYDVANVIVAAR